MPGPPIPEGKLRALVRERIERGALPRLLVRALDAGYGHDEPCQACGQTILETQIEYEVRETPDAAWRCTSTCGVTPSGSLPRARMLYAARVDEAMFFGPPRGLGLQTAGSIRVEILQC